MSLATVTTRLQHQVRLVHATTGTPIAGVVARLRPPTPGWAVRVVTGTVVVSARTDAPAPASPPQVAVTVTDGVTAGTLVVPPLPDEPPNTFVVDLTAAQVDVAVHPVPMTLTVELTVPSTGAPRTGRTLVARARSGPSPRPTIPLPEVAPGVYRSAAVEWTPRFVPADLLVGTRLLRTFAIDLSTTTTRLRLVDTT